MPCVPTNRYSTSLRFWPVEELAELADGPTGRGEIGRGVLICLELRCDKVNCTYGGGEKTLDQSWRIRCISDSLLAYLSKIPRPKTVQCTIPTLGRNLLSAAFIIRSHGGSTVNTACLVSFLELRFATLVMILVLGYWGKLEAGLIQWKHACVRFNFVFLSAFASQTFSHAFRFPN